jgi:hypothetical protein
MSAYRTMSVIVVQLDETSRPFVSVSAEEHTAGGKRERLELKLQRPEDVTDTRDWVRQIMAAVTEAV